MCKFNSISIVILSYTVVVSNNRISDVFAGYFIPRLICTSPYFGVSSKLQCDETLNRKWYNKIK